MIIFYIPNPTQYLNLTNTLLTNVIMDYGLKARSNGLKLTSS